MTRKCSARGRMVVAAALFGALVGMGGAVSFANTFLEGPVRHFPEYDHANQSMVFDDPGGASTFAIATSSANGYHQVGAQAQLVRASDDAVVVSAPWSYAQWSAISEAYLGNVRGEALYYSHGLTRVTAGLGFADFESLPTGALWMS